MTGTGLQGVKLHFGQLPPPVWIPWLTTAPPSVYALRMHVDPTGPGRSVLFSGTAPTHHVRTGYGGTPRTGRHGTHWVSAQWDFVQGDCCRQSLFRDAVGRPD